MDLERLVAWTQDPNRKPAHLAFTAGEARQAAYWWEMGYQKAKEEHQLTCTEETVFGCDSKVCGNRMPCPDHKDQPTKGINSCYQCGWDMDAELAQGFESASRSLHIDGTHKLCSKCCSK